MSLNILGHHIKHPVFVCKNLNQDAILGIDIISKINLSFNVKDKSFQINEIQLSQSWSLLTISSEKIPALTALPLRLQGVSDNGDRPPLNTTHLASIQTSDFPCLYANKGLVSPNRLGEVTVWVKNCHPFDIQLGRGEKIGSLEKVDPSQIAQIDQSRFLNEVQNSQKLPSPPVSSQTS